MIKISTYSKAYEACETFFLETGQMPTIEAIKPLIGVNSPSIISSAIKSWKNDLSQTVRNQQGPEPGIPKSVMTAVTELWAQALTEAKDSIKTKSDELDAQQAAIDQLSVELKAEADRVGQLLKVTEEKFQEEVTYLKKENLRLTTESLQAIEQLNTFRATVTAVDKKNAVLTEEIRQEKDKYHKLESQYDREHDWSLKRIEEEKENHRRESAQEMKRIQAESNRNKQAAEITQAKWEQLSKQLNDFREKASTLERRSAEEKLTIAQLTLDKADLQNQLNSKEEKIRLLLTKKTKLNTKTH
jgi:chromosome segregation ATPase